MKRSKAYLEALERAPLLVETERSHWAFKSEKYDAVSSCPPAGIHGRCERILWSGQAFQFMTQVGAMAEDMVYSGKVSLRCFPDDDHVDQ
jgi:hypothetical protein